MGFNPRLRRHCRCAPHAYNQTRGKCHFLRFPICGAANGPYPPFATMTTMTSQTGVLAQLRRRKSEFSENWLAPSQRHSICDIVANRKIAHLRHRKWTILRNVICPLVWSRPCGARQLGAKAPSLPRAQDTTHLKIKVFWGKSNFFSEIGFQQTSISTLANNSEKSTRHLMRGKRM